VFCHGERPSVPPARSLVTLTTNPPPPPGHSPHVNPGNGWVQLYLPEIGEMAKVHRIVLFYGHPHRSVHATIPFFFLFVLSICSEPTNCSSLQKMVPNALPITDLRLCCLNIYVYFTQKFHLVSVDCARKEARKCSMEQRPRGESPPTPAFCLVICGRLVVLSF
jgi:hypothetical protein